MTMSESVEDWVLRLPLERLVDGTWRTAPTAADIAWLWAMVAQAALTALCEECPESWTRLIAESGYVDITPRWR